MYSIIFNSDGTSSLTLRSLHDHFVNEGISFNLKTKDLFVDAGNYTQDISRFITLSKFTPLDLQVFKHMLLSEMCPNLSIHTTGYEFSDNANSTLILPNTDIIS